MEKPTILLSDFVGVLTFLGYRLVIICGTECEDEPKCIAECACEPAPINPFIERHKQEQAELERLGLDDLQSWERGDVKREAEKLIKEANITNEDDKLKVYRNTKIQYLEYKEYLKG